MKEFFGDVMTPNTVKHTEVFLYSFPYFSPILT